MFFFQFRCEKTHRTENGQASTNVSWITATKPKIYYINLKYQCKITQLSPVHPKMTWECRRNAVGMPSECHENAVGMPSECHQNVVRMPLECRRNAVGMPLECRRNAVSLLSECGLPYGKPAQGWAISWIMAIFQLLPIWISKYQFWCFEIWLFRLTQLIWGSKTQISPITSCFSVKHMILECTNSLKITKNLKNYHFFYKFGWFQPIPTVLAAYRRQNS